MLKTFVQDRLRWLIQATLLGCVGFLLLGTGCGTTPTVPTPTCKAGGCPSGSECVQDKYCMTVCPTGLIRCGMQCIDTQSDRTNCGACGKACKAEQLCSAGACQLPSAVIGCDPPCAAGQTCDKGVCTCAQGETRCNGACVVLLSSPQHCGACGNACQGGATCQQGKCTCANNQSYCNGQCVDTNASDANCGACGNACKQGLFCDVGKCICAAGQTDCNGTCVDTQKDTSHCGACGTVCLRSQSCTNSKCVCPSGTTACGQGATAACVNQKTDPKHCGACDKACTAQESCINGACVAVKTCSNGQADCGGTCVDLNADTKNCGSCGVVCQSNESCVGGSCKILQCKTGEVQCGNQCVDLAANSSHCGGCFNICQFSQRCTNRQCVPLCASGQTVCSGVCADLQTSSNHCGACGNACSAGNYCSQGKCTSFCKNNLAACSDGCVDLQIDPKNCGACGTNCDVCDKGQCICKAGKINCNNQCTDLMIDDNNCSVCGKVCPGDQSCEKGVCGLYPKKWYPDLDGDGFGDKTATPFEGIAKKAPPGWVANNQDCCDKDARVQPNQKNFFSQANQCGSYDYNCDGKDTPEVPVCSCSAASPWASNNVNFYSYYDGVVHGGGRLNGSSKTVPATVNPPANTNGCVLPDASVTFNNASAFTLSIAKLCCCGFDVPQKVGPFNYSWQIPKDSAGKSFIVWKKANHQAGCYFRLDGIQPKCGETKAYKSPASRAPLTINVEVSKKTVGFQTKCSYSFFELYTKLQGDLMSSDVVLTPSPDLATQKTIACQ